MSGGHFDYDQYKILNIIETIESIIHRNDSEEEDDWGDSIGRNYSEETIEEFKKAIDLMRKAYVYAQRIDWLLEGDDGENTFHRRLKEDLEKLND